MGFSSRRTTGVRQSEAAAKASVRVQSSAVQSDRPDVVRAVHVRSIDQESVETVHDHLTRDRWRVVTNPGYEVGGSWVI